MSVLARKTRIDDEDLAEIVEEMGGDGVWIHPSFARTHQLTARDEARLERLVAETDVMQLRIVLVDVDFSDDRFQGDFTSLSAWVHDDLGGDAVYLGAQGGGRLVAEEFGDAPEDLFYAADIAAQEHPDDVVAQVERTVELAEGGEDLYEQWSELREESAPSSFLDEGFGRNQAGDGPPWGGIVTVTVVLVAAVGAWLWRRGVRRGGALPGRGAGRGSARPFTLPPAVLRTVRAAEDRRLRQVTEAEVLALGEALGAQSPVQGREATWRQALDHYDAARSVLDRVGSPADVVGALVLARRGDSARRAALAGGRGREVWRPPLTCYFNPLHTGTVRTVTWQDGRRSVDVPACTACAPQVTQGREPEDALDFVDQGSARHYYRLDIGAWSETGYGALEPDLIGALRQGRRRRRRHAPGSGRRPK